MREPRDNDFFVELPGVGNFRFGRRTFGDRLAIRAQYLRYTKEFGDDDPDLSIFAAMIATHSVLCVEAPAGWEDLATLDMTDPSYSDANLYDLYERVRAKEDSFRKGQAKSGEEAGA